jgi:imidazolonepropionase-like amidohydrolase
MKRALVAAAFVAAAAPAAAQKAPEIAVVRAARLWDARSGRIVTPGVVAVQDGRILRVGSVPAGARVIELGDATLMPGLMDAHTHISSQGGDWRQDTIDRLERTPAETALRATEYARKTLLAGFTTVRNLGAGDLVDVALRNAIAAGKIVGPRMLASTWSIGTTGGHCDRKAMAPGLLREEHAPGVANGPDALRAIVRRNVRRWRSPACASGWTRGSCSRSRSPSSRRRRPGTPRRCAGRSRAA